MMHTRLNIFIYSVQTQLSIYIYGLFTFTSLYADIKNILEAFQTNHICQLHMFEHILKIRGW